MAKSKTALFLLLFLLLVYLVIVSNKGNKTKTPQVNSTNPVDILVIEGNKLADRQDYSHAIDKYYEALKLDSKLLLMLLQLGTCLLRYARLWQLCELSRINNAA